VKKDLRNNNGKTGGTQRKRKEFPVTGAKFRRVKKAVQELNLHLENFVSGNHGTRGAT